MAALLLCSRVWTLVSFLFFGSIAARPSGRGDWTFPSESQQPSVWQYSSSDGIGSDRWASSGEASSSDWQWPSDESSAMMMSNEPLVRRPCKTAGAVAPPKPSPFDRIVAGGKDKCKDPDPVFQESPEFPHSSEYPDSRGSARPVFPLNPEFSDGPAFSESPEFTASPEFSQRPDNAESPEFPRVDAEPARPDRQPKPPVSPGKKGVRPGGDDTSAEFPIIPDRRRPPATVPAAFQLTCAGYIISCGSRPAFNSGTTTPCNIVEKTVSDDNNNDDSVNFDNYDNDNFGYDYEENNAKRSRERFREERLRWAPATTAGSSLPDVMLFRCEAARVNCAKSTQYSMTQAADLYVCSFTRPDDGKRMGVTGRDPPTTTWRRRMWRSGFF